MASLDLSDVKLANDSTYFYDPASRLSHLRDDLVAAGFASTYKKYLVYYDTPQPLTPNTCGSGFIDPTRGGPAGYAGVFIAPNLESTPATYGCGMMEDPSLRGGYSAAVAAHELVHTLGALSTCKRRIGGPHPVCIRVMRIALMIEGQEGVTWEQWLALATAAEAAGLDGLFRSDHYRSIMRGDPTGSLDAWTTLAAIAARTERLRLGTMVSPVTFRPASVLAKAVTTVDHISNGRAELGIGAGWFEAEHETYGFPFRTTRERLDELDRQLAEITRQWIEAPDVWPKPVQQPRPPIIVGGGAKPRTVRAAVRFADEYNTVFPSVDEAAERRRILDDAAREAGRAPLCFSMMIGCLVGRDQAEVDARLGRYRELVSPEPPPITGTVEQVVEQLQAYEAVGVERAMLQHLVHEDVDMVTVLGDVAAGLR